MKKIIFCLACALFTVYSYGQLRFASDKIAKYELISSDRGKTVRLYKQADIWYLKMPSDNRFDTVYLFNLGQGTEEATTTLSDLLSLCNTLDKGESVAVNDGEHEYLITVGKLFGKKYLIFDSKGLAGSLSIGPSEIEKFIKAIADYSNKN